MNECGKQNSAMRKPPQTIDTHAVTEILQKTFGFDQFLPGQRDVVKNLLEGRSAAAIFPTGGGKSLCYQLPALMLPGVTLVVSPLVALMKDQIDALTKRGIAARRLDSTLSADAYRDVMNEVRSGNLRLLYVAPERFSNERFRQAIMRIRISVFAVDEAHCISEWGHNFRPDYLKLAQFATLCQAERILALTATATKQVLADICEALNIAPDCATCTEFYRPNLTLLSVPVAAFQRDDVLLDQLKERPDGPTIIYVTLQRTAEELADRLSAAGFQAKPYHAGLQNEVRTAVQDWFNLTETGIVVATIAFGMGVDKANIRYVYHYNLAKSLENYAQEVGRSGRDGAASTCQMFICQDDMNVLENFAYGDTPTLSSIQSLLDDLFSLEQEFDVSYTKLSALHDIRVPVVRTLLAYLELDGYLEGGTPFYSDYQFKPVLSSKEILARFEGERRAFLLRIFQQAKKGKIWLNIDVDQATHAIGAPRERIVQALDYLGEQHMVEMRAQGLRHRYRRPNPPEDLQALAQSLYQRATERETREIDRLRQVLDLAKLDSCHVSALCAYFDRPLLGPCGHCSWCLNDQKLIAVPQRLAPSVDADLPHQAGSLRQAYPDIFSDPAVLTRFLCGITSPRLIRAKLTSHKLFGSLEQVPYQYVLSQVRSGSDTSPE